MKQTALAASILSTALAACARGQLAVTQTAPAYVSIGPNVQVSQQNAGLAHGEELIAADPVDPRHLIGCSGMTLARARAFPNNGMRDVAYVTRDGGASWQQTIVSNVGAFDLDPVCAIGFNGLAYFGGASAFQPRPGHDWLARSFDGGLHWRKPTIFPWGDRDFIAIDTSGSPYHGRLYDVSLNVPDTPKGASHLGELRTNDDGTFLPPVVVFNNPRTHSDNEPIEYYSGPLTILRNGHVIEVAYNWPDSEKPKKIAVFVSTDGGATFSSPHVVATRAGSALISGTDFKEEGASVLPVIASDDSTGPFANRVYVAWQDFSKREYDIATSPAPQGTIMVAHSDNYGKTWSAPVEADDAPQWPTRRYPEVFAPTIAVNAHGIVAVAWFDARKLPDGSGGTLRMSVSNDGGDSFSPSFNVASAPALLAPNADRITLEVGIVGDQAHFLQDLRYHVFGQDTQGLVADAAGNFHPLWIDNRTGTAQLWTDSIAVHQRAVRNGDPALSSLSDVSKSVGLEVIGGTYDRRTQNVTADALLWNRSKRAIRGPIRLRITRLASQLGVPSMQDTGNGATSAGAIFTFVPLAGGMLAPKGQTKPVRLTFHIANPHAITPDDVSVGSINFISIAYRAYAH